MKVVVADKVNMNTNGPKRKTRSGVGTMRPEYDFSKGIRGKHADSYAAGTNVVVLEPDVGRGVPYVGGSE